MSLVLSGTAGVSDVDGTAATPALRGTDTNTGIFFPAADTIAFAEGGTEVARFDSAGNLGIGTSSPSYKLDVSGGGGSISTSRIINGNVGGSDGAQILLGNSANFTNAYFRLNGGGNSSQAGIGSLNIGVTESVPMAFYTNNTERARIDSSGRLLVGTTTSIANGLLAVRNTGAEACSFQGGSNNFIVTFHNTSGTLIGSITGSSGSTTSYNTSSDYRLKEDIQPMTGALAKVAALKPVTYKWKADGSDGQGFIAHELAEVCPDAVSGEKDAVNEDGSIKPQGIDTSFLVATLTAAIQELKAIVDAQAVEIAQLKGQA